MSVKGVLGCGLRAALAWYSSARIRWHNPVHPVTQDAFEQGVPGVSRPDPRLSLLGGASSEPSIASGLIQQVYTMDEGILNHSQFRQCCKCNDKSRVITSAPKKGARLPWRPPRPSCISRSP